MRKTKEQNAITLIALIITIVVLLILALVTINAVRGDGIIGKAWEARNKYSEAQAKEKVAIELEEWKIVKHTQADAKLDNFLIEKFGEENILSNEDGTYIVTSEGYGVIVDTNGDVIGVTSSNNDNNNDNTENGEDGNNPDEPNNPEDEIVDTRQEYTIGEIRTENGTINGEAYNSDNPIIPAGFQAKNTETSLWDAEGGPEVDNGLVITDGTNEFVWVPLTTEIAAYNVGTTDEREPDVVTQEWYNEYNPDTDTEESYLVDGADNNPTYLGIINEILGTTYGNSEDFKTALTEDFNSMATSANTYGGFYVGRYEMSLSNNKAAQSKYGEVSSNSADEDTNTWYGLYARAKTYNTSSVKSSMIWGSQWDVIMTWIGEADTPIDEFNMREDRRTGLVETDKIKNIYDLYGNYFEWTLEAYDTRGRLVRGGNYGGGCSPSNGADADSYHTFSDVGSRFTLYIV